MKTTRTEETGFRRNKTRAGGRKGGDSDGRRLKKKSAVVELLR